MKQFYAIITCLVLSTSVFAQAPELMSYQAIVRDSNDALIQNGNIGIQISVLQGSETGTSVYTETHTATTNDNGLVTLNIGAGATTNDFSTIDWSTGTYYVKAETDPAGGTNYSITGTSQLLSVPYALYAKSTETIQSLNASDLTGSIESDNGALGIMTTTTAYAFNSNQSGDQWWSQPLNGTPQKIIGSDANIGVLTSSSAYAFNSNQSGDQWWSQPLSGTPIEILGSNGNIAVLTSSSAYAFNSNQSGDQWWSQPLNGTPVEIVTSKGIIGVLTTNTAYAFNSNQSGDQWWSQPLNGTPEKIIAKNGQILVYTTNSVYAFNSNQSGDQWWSQPLNGTPINIAN